VNYTSIEMLRKEIEAELHRIIDSVQPIEPLRSAINHSLFPTGKLIRPLLCSAFFEDLGQDFWAILPVASSLELLHTSSLIHDDLPAMDDDDMRRGRPSCHKLFGEATAILAGDYLVALAHNVLLQNSFQPSIQARFARVMSDTYMRLCNGQQLDLVGSKTREDIEKIHSLKTAALFSATMVFPAIAAGIKEDAIKASYELGQELGFAFQIIDDYLDLFDSEKGREGGSDQKNDKTTFLNVETKEGIQHLAQMKKTTINRIFTKINSITEHAELDAEPEEAFPLTYPIVESIFSKIIL